MCTTSRPFVRAVTAAAGLRALQRLSGGIVTAAQPALRKTEAHEECRSSACPFVCPRGFARRN